MEKRKLLAVSKRNSGWYEDRHALVGKIFKVKSFKIPSSSPTTSPYGYADLVDTKDTDIHIDNVFVYCKLSKKRY